MLGWMGNACFYMISIHVTFDEVSSGSGDIGCFGNSSDIAINNVAMESRTMNESSIVNFDI